MKVLNWSLTIVLILMLVLLFVRRLTPANKQSLRAGGTEIATNPIPVSVNAADPQRDMDVVDDQEKREPRAGGSIRLATPSELRAAKARVSAEATKLRYLRQKQAFCVAYGRLLGQLNLDQQDEEKLISLLIDRAYIPEDVNSAVSMSLLRTSKDPQQVVSSALKATEEAIDAEIADLLGPNLEEYKRYQDQLPANLLTAQMQQLAAVAGAPLTRLQADGLFSVFQSSPIDSGKRQGMVVPVAEAEDATLVRNGASLIMLGVNKWYVDSNGLLSVNYEVTDQAWIRAAQKLSGPQILALQALRTKQEAQAKLAKTFNY